MEKLNSISSALACYAVENLKSLDNVTVMIILITDPKNPRPVRGQKQIVLDSYWVSYDVNEKSGEDGLNSSSSFSMKRRYSGDVSNDYNNNNIINNNSSNNNNLFSKSITSSIGGNKIKNNNDNNIINRMNSDSEKNEKKSGDFYSDTKSNYNTQNRKDNNVKMNDVSRSSGKMSSLHSNVNSSAEKKEKEKDEDDLMDYLMDDSNF